MFDSPRLNLPFVDGAQAQKHVTVNEALARLDAFASGRVETLGAVTPPGGAQDGEAHIVGGGAAGDWGGQDHSIAIFLNGGWEFVAPWRGACLWVDDLGVTATWDGAGWRPGLQAGSPAGAATLSRVVETEVALSGATVDTSPIIPDKAVVLGVTGRVTSGIAGASGWSLGVAGSPDRYGTGYGTADGAFAHGVTGQPQAYFGATPLTVTATGGTFTAGSLRLAVHLLELSPPV